MTMPLTDGGADDESKMSSGSLERLAPFHQRMTGLMILSGSASTRR